jgi:tetratricopeptide (TPR) repeat protein
MKIRSYCFRLAAYLVIALMVNLHASASSKPWKCDYCGNEYGSDPNHPEVLNDFIRQHTAMHRARSIPEPSEAERLQNEAHIALDNQQFSKAEELFKRVIRLMPNANAWVNLGYCIVKQDRNRYPEAMAAYGNALKLDPSDETAKGNLENWNSWLKEKNDAAIRKERLDYLSTKAETAYRQGRFDEAEEALREYISLNPSGGAYNQLGNTLDALERDSEAIAAYREAIERDSDSKNNMHRTMKLMKETQDLAKSAASLEDSPSVPTELKDQGVFAQLLDVQYNAANTTETLVRLSVDTDGHQQRGRRLFTYPPIPNIEGKPCYQKLSDERDAINQEVSTLRNQLISQPGTRAEIKKAVKRLSTLRAKSVSKDAQLNRLKDSKSLPPSLPKKEARKIVFQ